MKEMKVQQETEEIKEKKWKKIVKAIFSIIIFMFGLINCLGNAANSLSFVDRKIPYIIGNVIGALLIALLIFLVIKKEKRSFLKYSIIFLIIVLLSITGSRSKWKVSDVQTVVNYQKSISQDMLTGKEIASQDFDEKTYGKAAIVLKSCNNYVVDFITILKELNKTIEEQMPDNNKIQSKEVLDNQKKIAEYNAKYESVFQALNKAEEKVNQNNINLENELTKNNVPSKLKESIIKGVRESASLTYFQNTREYFTDQQKLLDFLVKNKDKYVFQGNDIVFNEKRDLDQYNLLIDNYNESIDRQTQL